MIYDLLDCYDFAKSIEQFRVPNKKVHSNKCSFGAYAGFE